MASNPDVPPFTGYVETTVNALRLIHAARQGVIPRITRRLNDSERRTMIKSGAVFVFSVEESGIKRWTDGLLWSPSRIVGNFLVYREINERTSSRGHKKPYPSDDSPTRTLIRKSSPDPISLGFKGHAADQGTFKAGGLIKKTITVTIEGSDLHLISYYTSEDIRSGKLKRPTTRGDIMGLYMPPHIFRLTNFRVPPKVEIGPDGKPRLVSEAEDIDSVDCKVEDHTYNIPGSPTWSSQGSPTSPIENPFSGNSMYPLNSSQTTNGGSGGYRTLPASERWPGQGESQLSPLQQRADLGWGSSSSSLSSSHTMTRRREGSVLHSEQWSPIQSQNHASRWQAGSSHESSTSSTSSSAGMYQDRPRFRTVQQQYEGGHAAPRQLSRSVYPHPTGTREGALQRLHWQARDATDSSRDLRRTSHSAHSFSPSPTLPFAPQGYHATPTYTSSWTSADASMLTTPTLHTIPNATNISYDATYSSTSASIVSSPDEYANVEEYRDS
ncbi:Gti1/Pac2 family-domain-containing protein [Pholiota molesta]|nr:Gti1/Pac2 family-domain-containing protein [Pholiota molesta]